MAGGNDAGDAVDGAVMFIHWTSMLLWELLSGKRHRNRNKNAARSDASDAALPAPDVVATQVAAQMPPLVQRPPLPPLTPTLFSADQTDRLTVAFQSAPKTPLATRRHSRRQRRRDDPSRIFERKRFKYFRLLFAFVLFLLPPFQLSFIRLSHSSMFARV